jgi:hypothetical protein
MQKLLVILSSALSLLLLPLAAAAPSVEVVEKQDPNFTEPDKGYAITFPREWHWQRDYMGLDVFAPAPPRDEQAGSMANISVVSGKIDSNIDLESFYNTNLENLKKALRDVQVVETGKVQLDGLEGRKVIYNHAMGEMKLRVLQYFVIKNGHGFIITCTSSLEEFPKYVEAFESTANSLKWQ